MDSPFMRFPVRAAFALLCLVSVTGRADPLRSARCDWAMCDGAPAAPASAAATAPSAPVGLPECAERDRGVCQEQCRTRFDADYHRCFEGCLGKRCVEPAPPAPPSAVSNDADLCVDGESTRCVDECRESPSLTRCRLDCLLRACPQSNRADIADEAAHPGAARCRRCKAREERECARSCRVGFSTSPGGRFNGLGAFGCEKACLLAACGSGCVF